jgi:hypothetical protein
VSSEKVLFSCTLSCCFVLLFCPHLQAEEGTRWYDDFGQAFEVAKEQQQPLFIYFTSRESSACRNFERYYLARTDIRQIMKGFINVRIYPEWNESLAEKYGVFRVPMVVLVAPDGQVLSRVQPPFDAPAFVELLRRHAVYPDSSGGAAPPPRVESDQQGLRVSAPSEGRAGEDLPVEVRAADVDQVILHFMSSQEEQPRSLMMSMAAGDPILWQASIPGRFIRQPFVDFYVTARSGETVLRAPDHPERSPFRIMIE